MSDLAGLLGDIEHVIVFSSAPEDALYGDVVAAARRSEREVSVVGDGGGSREVGGLLDAALDGYWGRSGRTAEDARRVSVYVADDVAGVRAAGAAGIRCIAIENKSEGKGGSGDDSGSGSSGGAAGRSRGAAAGVSGAGDVSRAAAVIGGLGELVDGLNARWDAQWCVRQYCG